MHDPNWSCDEAEKKSYFGYIYMGGLREKSIGPAIGLLLGTLTGLMLVLNYLSNTMRPSVPLAISYLIGAAVLGYGIGLIPVIERRRNKWLHCHSKQLYR